MTNDCQRGIDVLTGAGLPLMERSIQYGYKCPHSVNDRM